MERLTQASNKGGVAFTFDLDITCEPSEAKKILRLAEKLKQYEDLGTVEELQQAIEKQTAKKVIKIDSGVHDYEWDSKCPTCGNYLDDDEHHCECGQKLDWSE